MELKVTGKHLDTTPLRKRLTQGEAMVDRPRIILPRSYEGLDISALHYEMRAVSEKETMVRRALEKNLDNERLILTWTVTAEFTAVAGMLKLTVIGIDSSGAEIIKITSDGVSVKPDPEGEWTAPPPDVIGDAINQMTVIQAAVNNSKDQAVAAADRAEQASKKNPYIGGNGNWYVWNGTAYVDSGVGATGPQGAKGDQGNIGPRGPKGDPGAPLHVAGSYPTAEALEAAHPAGDGDNAYLVAGAVYVWDGTAWIPASISIPTQVIPCDCVYDAPAHTFRLNRKDTSQELRDGVELQFVPPAGYTRGDLIEVEGQAFELAYAGSIADIQTGAWLADRPCKLCLSSRGGLNSKLYLYGGHYLPQYRRTHKNCLINGDFRRPVNQRRLNVYTDGYGIDGWYQAHGRLTLGADGAVAKLENTDTANGRNCFVQKVAPKEILGHTWTYSIACKNLVGELRASVYGHNQIAINGKPMTSDGITSITFSVDKDAEITEFRVHWLLSPGGSCTPIAAKLEDGTDSTLWLDLLDQPDFDRELRRCQQYLFPLPEDGYMSGWINQSKTIIHIPFYPILSMRTAPRLILPEELPLYIDCNGVRKMLTLGGNVTRISISGCHIALTIDNAGGGFEQMGSHACGLYYSKTARAYLSCEP